METAEKTERGMAYKWRAMTVVMVGAFMATSDSGAVRISLPHLGQVFHADPNTIIWVWLIYLLMGTGLMLTMGRIGDAFGRKRLYTLGFIIFSLGMGLCSLAQGLIPLVMFRLIQAIGGAMTVSTGNAIITAAFPQEERGKAIGIMGAMVGIGMLTGPVIGGFLLDFFGWRAVFYLRVPIGLIGAILAWILLKEQTSPRREGKFDLRGAVILFFTLACLLLAVNRGQSLGWTSPLVVSLGAMGVLLFFSFLFVERGATQPVLDLRLYSSRLFSIASISHVSFYMSTVAVSFLMPFYLIQGLGFSAARAGLILVTIPAASAVLSPLSGRLSDRLGTLFLCTPGLALVAVGLFLLDRLGTDASISTVVLYLATVGVGMGLFASPNTSAIMGSVPIDRLGTASAMVGTLRQIGMSFGLALTGALFAASQLSHAAQLASRGLSEDLVQKLSTVNGIHDALVVALIIALIGLAASLFRGRR